MLAVVWARLSSISVTLMLQQQSSIFVTIFVMAARGLLRVYTAYKPLNDFMRYWQPLP
jgi:hypothetical protein